MTNNQSKNVSTNKKNYMIIINNNINKDVTK